jgi:hypothetical protein
MIMARRLDQGIAHLADIFPPLGQFRTERDAPEAVKGFGKLIDVRANLAEMAKKASQLPALDRWAADSRGPGEPSASVRK